MTGTVAALCAWLIMLGLTVFVIGLCVASVPAIIAGLWIAAAGMVGLNNIGRRGRR